MQTPTNISDKNITVDKIYSAFAFSKAYREIDDPIECVKVYQGMMELRKNWSDKEFDEFYNIKHPGLGDKYREQN